MPETGQRTHPLVAFRFEVELDNFAVSAFSECSGIQLETEVMDYPEGGLNTFVHKFPGRTKQSNLQLRRGVADRHLWDWYFAATQGSVTYRNASIRVLDSDGTPAMEWRIFRAFPCKWTGPTLNATQSSVAVELLELCHQGLQLAG